VLQHSRAGQKHGGRMLDHTDELARVDTCLASFENSYYLAVGRDSSVGIATRYGLWERDFPQAPRTALGPTQPPL
jgi:hypothetical protein